VVEAGRHRGKGLHTEIEENPSQLRVDITVALALLMIAKAGRPEDPIRRCVSIWVIGMFVVNCVDSRKT